MTITDEDLKAARALVEAEEWTNDQCDSCPLLIAKMLDEVQRLRVENKELRRRYACAVMGDE